MAIAGLYDIFNHWHQVGTVYLYSDPHFGDKDIPNRPTDEEQLARINSKVGKKDTIIILGDCGDTDFIRRIRAQRKILVIGNHDAGKTNYQRNIYRRRFDADEYTEQDVRQAMNKDCPDCRIIIGEGYNVSHSPFHYWEVWADNCLFEEVYEGPLVIGPRLILSHEPVDVPWAMNIHGHIHDPRHKNDERHFNVCAEAIDFMPLNFNKWMKEGHLSHIEDIHRDTIDRATERCRKREARKKKQN